ncbi:TonB-dependent receptor [Telluria beijingensis]|uniref:TonB-dependent receptor n=1 Tax=Telluria beijingensis TaxID=3068633 RepID=UPI0027958803|nr:TonB-dependent receptor [Massilia sp. REN29]
MNQYPHRAALRKLTLCLLGTASVSALSLGPAFAQEVAATPTGAETATAQTVVVTGLRASLESALNAKRQDNGIVDVIKSEDMGKFPDTNLAESLQRVPGVVIDRDAGEGRSITVRGLGQDFTRVRINGIEGLATTGGTDSSGGTNRGRGFDFNVFASELFSALTVRKSSSADVDEGSLGATVDLQTLRPFDLRGFNATVALKGKYNDGSEKTDPRAAFMVSNTFFDRKVGVLFSGAYSKRRVLEDGFSTVRWDNGPSSGGWCAPQGMAANPSNSTATTCGPAAQGAERLPGTPENIAAYNAASDPNNFHPRLPRYGRLTHDQDRLGLTGSVQWRPRQGTLLTFDMLYSKLDATRQEDFLQATSFSRSASQGGKPQVGVLEAQYAPNGSLLYGRYNNVDIRSEQRFDELKTTFTQPTLTLEHKLSDTWSMSARYGRAESKFRNPIQTTVTLDALNVDGYSIDFRNDSRRPLITYPFDVNGGPLGLIGVPQVASGTQPTTVPNTTTSEIRIRPQGTDNVNNVAQFDLAWEASDSLTFKGGINSKKYTSETYEFRRVNQNDTIFAPPAGATGLTSTMTGFGSQLGMPAGNATGWVMPNLQAIAAAYDIYCNCIKSGPAGGPGDFTLSSIENGNARGNNRAVTEKSDGVYLMGEFRHDLWNIPVRGNIGVRYVKTDLETIGYQAAGGGTQVKVNHDYTDTLPSFNLTANVTDEFIVRFGAAKVMTRPQLGFLSPGGSIATTGNLSINSGNPFLKPFRAKTFDSSFEYYFANKAFVGLGLFQKNIDTYIQSLRTNVPFRESGLPLSLLPANFTGEEVFQQTLPVNTDGGKLKGFEISYQQPFTFLPGWGKNFGTLLNYTKVSSKIEYLVSPTGGATITDDLLNLSPKSWNATFFYDDGKFSARISGAKRSGFVTRVPGQNNNDVEGKNETFNVDLSLSYKVNENLEFTLEGVNLTNEENDQFISRQRDSVVVNNVTGREYLFGLRYKF